MMKQRNVSGETVNESSVMDALTLPENTTLFLSGTTPQEKIQFLCLIYIVFNTLTFCAKHFCFPLCSKQCSPFFIQIVFGFKKNFNFYTQNRSLFLAQAKFLDFLQTFKIFLTLSLSKFQPKKNYFEQSQLDLF